MNESDFKSILAEICEEEAAELNRVPPFKPSLRHRRAMKRIFVLYEKNTYATESSPAIVLTPQIKNLRFCKRVIIFFILILCAAIVTGFTIAFFSRNFYGTVYNDSTQIFAVNTENCLTTIEYEYYLSELPDGFEMTKHDSLSFDVYTVYEDKSSGKRISFSQCAKNCFSPHYNTEKHDFEEIDVNGHAGLCIDFSDDKHNRSIVVWDNGDYILEIVGNLSKNELLNLAESAKILEN